MSSAGLAFMCLLFFAFDAERIDDAGDPLGIFVDKFSVSIAAKNNRRPAEPLKGFFPRRRLGGAAHDLDQRVALRGGYPRCAESSAPVGQLHAQSLFLEGRKSLEPRGARHRQRAHAPAFDLLGEFTDTGNSGGYMAADDRRDRFTS